MKRILHSATLCAAAVALGLDSAQAQAQGPLVRVPGSLPGSQAGFSSSVIGDLTGDGMAEYIVGEPFDWFFTVPANPSYYQGNIIVFNGATGATLFTDYGSFSNPGDRLGISCTGLGDLNGDGIPEYCAGAVQGNTNYPPTGPGIYFSGQGYVRVYDGATGALIRQLSGVTAPPPGNGVSYGQSVANLGDVDGDGISDLAVGSPYDMWSGSGSQGVGQVWVYSGASIGSGPTGNIPPLYNIVSPFYLSIFPEAFGSSIDGISDLDGDGANEILIGAPESVGGPIVPGTGAAYVYSGSTGALLSTDLAAGGFAKHGHCVRRAGDVDLDGFEDFMVGAPSGGSYQDEGYVRVVSGATGAALFNFQGDDIYAGLGVTGIAQLGYSVAGVGDLNGDGYPDFALGAPGDTFVEPDATAQALAPAATWFAPPTAWTPPYQGFSRGTVRIMSGRSGSLLKVYTGAFTFAGLGASLAGGADIDGDGIGDIVCGATGGQTAGPGYHEVESGAYQLGQVYGYSLPNTTGSAATLRATGSLSMAENDLRLTVQGLPGGTTGLFYFGAGMLSTPIAVSTGLNWIGGTTYRTALVAVPPAGPSGTATLTRTLNLNLAPFAGLITPGSEFAFQFYYRNAGAGPGAANLSDALNIGFMP